MTIGEKLKEVRKNAGMTQEELAKKLMVSRAAIAKWESDKGVPDISNLKAIAKLLNISIDYLVDDGHEFDMSVIREPVDLSKYGKGSKSVKKVKIVRDHFTDCDILILEAKTILTKREKITDIVIGLLSGLFGVPDIIHQIRRCDTNAVFYFVEDKDKTNQYIVSVTDEYIEKRRIASRVENKKGAKFVVGDTQFVIGPPIKWI